jgi:DNA replication and repair protein RecF
MVEHGTEIRRIRQDWITWLNPVAQSAHQRLAPGEGFLLTYEPREQDLALALSSRREDLARGTTTCGPHRDELLIEVGGKAVRTFGSQGQQRTSVISLKLAVLESAREVFGFPPVLLLDDVFSDLDQNRRSALVSAALNEGGQVFLTCTEPGQVGGELLRSSTIFLVQSGRMGHHEATL